MCQYYSKYDVEYSQTDFRQEKIAEFRHQLAGFRGPNRLGIRDFGGI